MKKTKKFIDAKGNEVSRSEKTNECLIFDPKDDSITIMTKLLPTDEQLRKASEWLTEWGGDLDVSENGDGVSIETDPNTFIVKLKGEKITEAAETQIVKDWLGWVNQFAEEKRKADSPKPAKPEENPKPEEDPKPTAKPAEEDPDPGPTDSGKDSGSPFVAGEKPYWEEPQEKWGEIFDRQVDFYLNQYGESAS